MELVFENFDPFMVKIGVKGHSFRVSGVKIGPKILFFKLHEIFTRKAFQVEKFSSEVGF